MTQPEVHNSFVTPEDISGSKISYGECLFFGCDHSSNYKQGELILDLLDEKSPKIIVLEGMVFWNKADTSKKNAFLSELVDLSLQDLLAKFREKGAVYYYLCQHLEQISNGEIDIISGEGTFEDEVESLVSSNYEIAQIHELYSLREIESYYRNLAGKFDNFNYNDLVRHVQNFWNYNNLQFNEEQISLLIAEIAQKYNLNLQEYEQKTHSLIKFYMIPKAKSQFACKQVKHDLSNIRDGFLLQKIDPKINTFIMYGEGHIRKISRILEKTP